MFKCIFVFEGYHSSAATNVQHPQRSDAAPSRSRDLPTPEVLGSVIERARQLLTGSAASALSVCSNLGFCEVL